MTCVTRQSAGVECFNISVNETTASPFHSCSLLLSGEPHLKFSYSYVKCIHLEYNKMNLLYESLSFTFECPRNTNDVTLFLLLVYLKNEDK